MVFCPATSAYGLSCLWLYQIKFQSNVPVINWWTQPEWEYEGVAQCRWSGYDPDVSRERAYRDHDLALDQMLSEEQIAAAQRRLWQEAYQIFNGSGGRGSRPYLAGAWADHWYSEFGLGSVSGLRYADTGSGDWFGARSLLCNTKSHQPWHPWSSWCASLRNYRELGDRFAEFSCDRSNAWSEINQRLSINTLKGLKMVC